jgi:hypothetical protein
LTYLYTNFVAFVQESENELWNFNLFLKSNIFLYMFFIAVRLTLGFSQQFQTCLADFSVAVWYLCFCQTLPYELIGVCAPDGGQVGQAEGGRQGVELLLGDPQVLQQRTVRSTQQGGQT